MLTNLKESNEKWRKEEGGIERPTQICTLEQPCQKRRIDWLCSKAKGSVLELGCNRGYVLRQICNAQKLKGVGVDINIDNIIQAKQDSYQDSNISFVCADITSNFFTIPMNTFDTIMLPDVIEHIEIKNVSHILYQSVISTKDIILITVPWEKHKRLCFKHRWEINEDFLNHIQSMLREYCSFVEKENDGDFIYIAGYRKVSNRDNYKTYIQSLNEE